MARQEASFVENKFIKGLITQTEAMSFPTDACTETWDCVFDETGLVTRRPSFDIEDTHTELSHTVTPGDAWVEYEWTNTGEVENLSFVVQQQGSTIYFFEVSDSTNVSSNKKQFSIDLTEYTDADATTLANSPCQFAQGNGSLFIVNRYFTPMYVEYDSAIDNITVTTITLRIRDFVGLDDGLDLTKRPTYSVATLKTGNPSHYYNILNQGWYFDNGTSLAGWDTSRSDMPSNADYPTYYRKANDDAFNATLVVENDGGNTPAPKGHFILDFGVEDRTAAMVAEGFTGVTVQSSKYQASLISTSSLSTLGDMTNPSNAFDGDSSDSIANSATKSTTTSSYIGVDLVTARAINSAVVYAPSDGLLYSSPFISGTITIYGKATAPANATDGTALGSKSITPFSSNEAFTVYSSNTTSTYQYVWVTITSGLGVTHRVAEVYFYEQAEPYNFPSTVAFFNNRLFYAGWYHPGLAPYVLFSQVIEDEDQYGDCYQLNDPTSDKIADLLATDGGTTRIPDVGFICKLVPFQTQMLILGSNGVWSISGGSDNVFSATGYSIRRISNVGSTSPYSVADVKGLPIWFAEDGIYTVTFDPNYNSITLKTITEETIKDFFLDISPIARRYVKAAYDKLDDIVYWVFRSSEPSSTEYWDYDRVLCLNVKSLAFFPWTISESSTNPQIVHGIIYVQDGQRSGNYSLKLPFTYDVAGDRLCYADVVGTTYKDWTTYASDISSTAGDEEDYSSYFIAGYRVDGEGMRKFQSNYFFLFMKKETDASAFVQGLYDFSDSSSSVKWSTAQQGYNSLTTRNQAYRSTRIKKMKIRGHGRALQIKVYSEEGKPFSIIALGYYETANASI